MSVAWDVFVSSLDIDSLELERTHQSAPREVVVHDLMGERFRGPKHDELMVEHELRRLRFEEQKRFADDPRQVPVNRYKVKPGQFWMLAGRRVVQTALVEIVSVSRGYALTHYRGRLKKVPLEQFHGQRGGYGLVSVDAQTAELVRGYSFTDRQVRVARAAQRERSGFAKGITADETSFGTAGAVTGETVREGAPQRKEAA